MDNMYCDWNSVICTLIWNTWFFCAMIQFTIHMQNCAMHTYLVRKRDDFCPHMQYLLTLDHRWKPHYFQNNYLTTLSCIAYFHIDILQFMSHLKLQLIMVQQLMKNWLMDLDGKKFGGGKSLSYQCFAVLVYFTYIFFFIIIFSCPIFPICTTLTVPTIQLKYLVKFLIFNKQVLLTWNVSIHSSKGQCRCIGTNEKRNIVYVLKHIL